MQTNFQKKRKEMDSGESSGTVPVSSSNSPLASPSAVEIPCAACKVLRRKCTKKCVLGPYFPPTDPLKFSIAHRVFGASNITKFLQEVEEGQRADTVSSMVYEANARIRDPVYGCAGAICHLQNQVNELKQELAKSQADLVNIHCQHSNLISLICESTANPNFFIDDTNLASMWDPLWT